MATRRPVQAHRYRNPWPKAERCERCDRYRADCRLTLTNRDGVLLDQQRVCSVCARDMGLQPGASDTP